MKIKQSHSITSIPWVKLLTLAACAFLVFTSMVMAAEAGAVADDDKTMWGLIKKGGLVMIPLAIVSILALALGIERFISLNKSRLLPDSFTTEFGEVWANDPSGEEAEKVCDKYPNSAAHVFKATVQWRNQGQEAIGKAIEDAGSREAEKLKRSVRPLSVIAGICPLLGLLGTVYGMIDAFQETADAGGAAKTADLANGIYQALISTAAGLTIAIPVLLLYQWLSTRADKAIDHLDEAGTAFLVQNAQAATTKNTAARKTPPKKTATAAKKTATAAKKTATAAKKKTAVKKADDK